MILTDALCGALCNAAYEESKNADANMSFSIVDAQGRLLLYRRFENAPLVSVVLVPKKAYTSAATGAPTEAVAAGAVEGGPLYGIDTADPQICLITGGFPLYHDGKLVGAIGVGGGSPEQDTQVGKYVLKAFEDAAK